MIENVIAVAIILLIVGGAILYIVKAKKKGQKCIGCPSGSSCGSCKACQGYQCQDRDEDQ